MRDIHTHILPGIDDGAPDKQTALEMLKEDTKQGVREVVFTPHYYGKKHSPEQFLKNRAEAFEKIQGHIPKGISVRLGAEVYFSNVNTVKNDVLCSLAIEGTRYVLIELPFTKTWSDSLFDQLQNFINETDYTPIIAHIERYWLARKKPSVVSMLVHMGCLIQVNTGAFLNKRDRKFVMPLLKKGLVHCLGTDTHDMKVRKPDYEAAVEYIKKAGQEKALLKIQDNMRRVLANRPVRVGEIKTVNKFFGGFF